MDERENDRGKEKGKPKMDERENDRGKREGKSKSGGKRK